MFEELFAPGRKHANDERKRLELTRVDLNDGDPGRGPIDLSSGKVVVRSPHQPEGEPEEEPETGSGPGPEAGPGPEGGSGGESGPEPEGGPQPEGGPEPEGRPGRGTDPVPPQD